MKRTKFPRKKPGPKGAYSPAIAKKAFLLALYGLLEREMAEVLGVRLKTWEDWKSKYPELREQIDRGKFNADCEVVRALYKKAIGFEINSVHVYIDRDGNAREHPVKKYFPPDIKAIQMWLSNRTKGRWTTIHHHKVEHSGEIAHRYQDVDLGDFTMDELKVLKKYALKQN